MSQRRVEREPRNCDRYLVLADAVRRAYRRGGAAAFVVLAVLLGAPAIASAVAPRDGVSASRAAGAPRPDVAFKRELRRSHSVKITVEITGTDRAKKAAKKVIKSYKLKSGAAA